MSTFSIISTGAYVRDKMLHVLFCSLVESDCHSVDIDQKMDKIGPLKLPVGLPLMFSDNVLSYVTIRNKEWLESVSR